MWGLSLPASLRPWRAPVTLEAHNPARSPLFALIKAIVCRWRLSGPQLPRRLPCQLCRGRRLDVNRRLAATRIRRVRTYLGAASHELMSLVFDEFFGELP